MSKTLNEFRDLVNSITDDELLDAAETVLREMVQIQQMKELIKKLEDEITDGKKSTFWFFAASLDQENEVDLATNTVIGRRRVLADKIKQKDLIKEMDASKLEVKEEVIAEAPASTLAVEGAE
jgi:hypothetical protein